MNRFTTLIILSACFLFMNSCKSDGPASETVSPAKPMVKSIDDLRSAYKSEANKTSGSALVSSIVTALKTNKDSGTRTSLLNEGYKVATEQNISGRAAGFLFPLIKESASPATPDQLYDLGKLMKGLGKEAASNTIFQGITDRFSSYAKIDEVKSMITTPMKSSDDYIFGLGEKLFVDADNTGINKDAAMKYVDACEAYALAYPDNKGTADNLFKAAEVAKSIRTFPKSLALYDWILEKYPNYEKAPTSLFLKGFIIENNMKDDKKAGEIYRSFLAKYPKHDLADDVEFLIENLGKSDQQILEMIEAKRQENEAKK